VKKYLWEITYLMPYNLATFEVITKEKEPVMAAEAAKKYFQIVESDYDTWNIIGIIFKGFVYE